MGEVTNAMLLHLKQTHFRLDIVLKITAIQKDMEVDGLTIATNCH
jgi:hypothetical protein